MASTLTIKLDDIQTEQLKKLKTQLNQATGTKAIFDAIQIALVDFPELAQSRIKILDENHRLEQLLRNILQDIDQVRQAEDKLQEQIDYTRSELDK